MVDHSRESHTRSFRGGIANKDRTVRTTNNNAVVRIYIEGGSTGSLDDQLFRQSWLTFLSIIDRAARKHGFNGINIIRGQSRGRTHARFCSRHGSGDLDLNILLLDSEEPSAPLDEPWLTITKRISDSLPKPTWANDEHLYLMVPTVEAWLLTDHEELARY